MFLKLRLQVIFDDLVNDLYLAVCLRMINLIEAFLDVEFVIEYSELCAVELCAIV